ncbi:MAG: NAD(P)-dependent oxidoreductase [Granulosicoccus sp.]|nr:NAD(P)-dependent oxidoreductase [Granulosicoccus sp.]
MIIIDTALQRRAAAGNPIRVGMTGAGAMARGVALQLLKYCPGFYLAGVSNRHVEGAVRLYREAGVSQVVSVDSRQQLNEAVARGQYCVMDDPGLLCACPHLDVIIEITGAVDFGAQVVMAAIEHGKHVVMMNAELDSTVGPILKTFADEAGVVLTNVDGDQPGVLMNLYRFVRGIGVNPVLCGNIKGLQDEYRTPTTQAAFAQRWKQSAPMVTSFADGTKVSFEQALVANATDMRVAQRGMFGPTVEHGQHVDEAGDWFPVDLLKHPTGIVDYVVGASPGPGVFILGTHDDPAQQHLLEMYKLGTGPLYTFYTPYHLCHFEVHNTIARAVLFDDAAIAPAFGPCVDVVATAKRDLRAGETLDGIGHYMTYGQCENSDLVYQERLLPMGLAEGCVLLCDIARDTTLSLDDVRLPTGRFVDNLREQQDSRFFASQEPA